MIAEEQSNDSNLSTETRVQVKISEGKKKKYLNGLFDSAATGVHIKRSAFKNIRYKALAANVKVRGRYSVSHIKQMVEFECNLILDFKHNKVIWDDMSIPMRKS